MAAKKKAPKAQRRRAQAPKAKAPKAGAAKPKPPKSAPYSEGKWAEWFVRKPGERRYWLAKSEPETFSWDDLLAAPGRTTHWDGVRNTAARNFLRDGMQVGDQVFFYHSMADPAGIVGICEVVRAGYPDHTAFDPKHEYHDPGSHPDAPTWFMVDLKAVRPLERMVTLPEIKATKALAGTALLRVSRLSVVPVAAKEWETILALSEQG
jgi:predicted RNA-binding protein with PUA-like domain